MKSPSGGKSRRRFHGGPARHDLPRTADDIDLDRLVWDPAYRRAVRPLIEAEDECEDSAPE
jgi:hypothetical protein